MINVCVTWAGELNAVRQVVVQRFGPHTLKREEDKMYLCLFLSESKRLPVPLSENVVLVFALTNGSAI